MGQGDLKTSVNKKYMGWFMPFCSQLNWKSPIVRGWLRGSYASHLNIQTKTNKHVLLPYLENLPQFLYPDWHTALLHSPDRSSHSATELRETIQWWSIGNLSNKKLGQSTNLWLPSQILTAKNTLNRNAPVLLGPVVSLWLLRSHTRT